MARGFLYGVRVADRATAHRVDPDDVLAVAVMIPGVRYEPTAAPSPPPFLGTPNLQQAPLPGDPSRRTEQSTAALRLPPLMAPAARCRHDGHAVAAESGDRPADSKSSDFISSGAARTLGGPFADLDEAKPSRRESSGNRIQPAKDRRSSIQAWIS